MEQISRAHMGLCLGLDSFLCVWSCVVPFRLNLYHIEWGSAYSALGNLREWKNKIGFALSSLPLRVKKTH